jgi:hypothetical protein
MDHGTHPFRELTGTPLLHPRFDRVGKANHPEIPAKNPRVISASSQISCRDLLLCRTLPLNLAG